MKSIKQGYHNLMMKYSKKYSIEHYIEESEKLFIGYEYEGIYENLEAFYTSGSIVAYTKGGRETITIVVTLQPLEDRVGYYTESVDLNIYANDLEGRLLYTTKVTTYNFKITSKGCLDALIDAAYLEYLTLILKETKPEIFNKHSKKSLYWLC